MMDGQREFEAETFISHCPVGEEKADAIMSDISRLTAQSISEKMKISLAMAGKILTLAYDFPNKSTGVRTIESYTGVVFKALDYDSLCENAKANCSSDVRIISSLYGYLRPDDIIKPYRFDYNARLAPDDKTLADFWRKDVTIQLVKELQAKGETSILNLLPSDAAKCIDWKLVKRFAKVWKVDFKEIKEGGEWKTPHAGKLKTLRGELLRTILKQDLKDPTDLITLETDNLLPLGTPDYPDHIAFCG